MNRFYSETRPLFVSVVVLVSLLFSSQGHGQSETETNTWPGWRGPLATGESPHADPPTSWNETEQVKWKAKLPGRGHSTPIVWGDTIFVTAAEPFGDEIEPKFKDRPGAHDNLAVSQKHRFLVVAVDRKDGSIRWQENVHEALPREGAHYTASLASASCVTDGQHVIAHFGSYGIYCLDFKGNLVWQKALGTMHTKHGHGEGCSPVLHDDRVIVNWDHEEKSFIAAFNVNDGKEIWRVARAEVTSWSTPIVVEHAGKWQVVVAGTNRLRGYDLADGSVIWECGGLSNNVVASPVAGDGMVFAGSSYDTRAMFAVTLDGAKGDITGSENVAWFNRERTPYVPSPLLYKGSLYYLRHYQNILTRRHAESGEERSGPFRLSGLRDIYASPVAAQNRIYVTDREGVTVVFGHTEDEEAEVPRMLAVNPIGETVNASLALVGKQIFIRGEQHLFCIE